MNRIGDTTLYYLDLDFEGYVAMMCESRAYKSWPYLLLNIQDDELDSALITSFKKDMPLIFDDFSWDEFLEKYESLRLSKNI